MGVTEQLRIDSQHEHGRLVIRLDGELDMASAPLLQEALEQATPTATAALVLDLQQLRFMDSTGLRVILAAQERLRENGQELALTAGSSQVQRLLAVSGVAGRLRVLSTPDELLA